MSALILGGLLRRFGAVLFGIGAIREKAQRGLVQLRRDAIGRKPDLQIINDGAVECRLSARLPKSIQGGDTVHWTDKLAELGKRKLSVDTQDSLAKFYGNDFYSTAPGLQAP